MTDDIGLLQTRSRTVKAKTKAKGKRANQRKNIQKAKYGFVPSSKRGAVYADYFNPDVAVERRILGLVELVIFFFSVFSGNKLFRRFLIVL
jgi:meiosis-specific protein